MLKIKHTHQLDFPHMSFHLAHPMRLSPVAADNDELTQAIDNELAAQEDNWELSERPDTTELEKFWSDVEDDVRHDPDWVDFSKDQ